MVRDVNKFKKCRHLLNYFSLRQNMLLWHLGARQWASQVRKISQSTAMISLIQNLIWSVSTNNCSFLLFRPHKAKLGTQFQPFTLIAKKLRAQYERNVQFIYKMHLKKLTHPNVYFYTLWRVHFDESTDHIKTFFIIFCTNHDQTFTEN